MKLRNRFPWVAASMVATALVGAVILAINLPAPVRSLGGAGAPDGDGRGDNAGTLGRLQLSELQEATVQASEIDLNDPTPLFLPTRWNSGRVDPAMTEESSPGTSFTGFEVRKLFADAGNKLGIPDVVPVPASALGSLNDVESPIELTELARADAAGGQLTPRAGRVEARRLTDGKVVCSLDVPVGTGPAAPFSPVQLMVVVSREGLMSTRGVLDGADDLARVGGFANQAPDFDRISRLLVGAGLANVLSPGIYRISIGP